VTVAEVFHRPARWCAAALCLTAAGLAGASAVPALHRLGPGQAAVFMVVAVLSAVLATAVLRAARWALWLCLVSCGGQVTAIAGTTWELAHGVDAAKARQIRALGVDPETGVTVNLVYSALATALFVWLAVRWLRAHRRPRPSSDRTGTA
jgi:hypothetical protein